MHLGRRGKDYGIGALDALGELAGVMGNAVFLRNLCRRILIAAYKRGDLNLGNAFEGIEVLLAEGALTG